MNGGELSSGKVVSLSQYKYTGSTNDQVAQVTVNRGGLEDFTFLPFEGWNE